MDFQPLAAALLSRASDLLPAWFPEGRFEGREFCIGDLSGARGDSLKVNTATGVWTDFADSDSGGRDLISLYAATHNLRQGEAARELAEAHGYTIEARPASRAPPAQAPLIRPNGHAEGFTGLHFKHGLPTDLYPYRDLDGEILFFIARYDLDAGKTFTPWRWDGQAWVMKAVPTPRPLFGLELLRAHAGARVLLVEGERCALSARRVLRPDANIVLTWPGGANAVDAADWEPLRGRTVTIWPDADKPGRQAAARAAALLLDLGCEVWVLAIPEDRPAGWDIADAIQEGMRAPDLAGFAKQYRRRIERVPPKPAVALPAAPAARQPPQALLSVDPEDDDAGLGAATAPELWQRWGLELVKGIPFPNLDNVVRVLARHPDLRDDLWYDEFSKDIMIRDKPYIFEEDAGPIAIWCQAVLKLHKVGPPLVDDAIGVYARTRGRHPLREEIDALQWDGVRRIEDALPLGFGAEPSEYHRAVGRTFFISLMARLYDPGCICRLMPVFEGEQLTGKSTALSIIGGRYYMELTEAMGSLEFNIALGGKWLVEVAELHGLTASSQDKVKAAVSRRDDHYRGKYEKKARPHPRQCVLTGTTNAHKWLIDETGASRFLPVRCGAVDLEWVAANRLQLLAEARDRYRTGEDWYKLPEGEALEQRERRYQSDPWEDAIAGHVSQLSRVTIPECLSMLDLPTGERDRRHSIRVGSILRRLGFEPKTVRIDGLPHNAFVRIEKPQPAPIEREPGSDDDA